MAYTDFFVTHGSSAANTNGGGPRLGTNDGPIYTTSNSTVSAEDTVTIVDNSGNNWSGVAVDDWICWDTAGVKEFRRVDTIAPDEDATKITISAAATAGSSKTTNVGGAWATIDFAASTMSTTFINNASDPPRTNIKNDGNYTEKVTFDYGGSSTINLFFEGYTTTVGDGGKPYINYTVSGNTLYHNKYYVNLKNLRINGTTNSGTLNPLNMYTTSGYSQIVGVEVSATYMTCISCRGIHIFFENCSVYGGPSNTRTGMIAYAGGCCFIGCYAYGHFGTVFENYYNGVGNTSIIIDRCINAATCTTGFYVAYAGNKVFNCINWGTATNAFLIDSYHTHFINCIACNATYGFKGSATTQTFARKCAVYNCDNDYTDLMTAIDPIALSANPFTDTANGDFTLNSEAGGGALLKGTGIPTTLPIIEGTNNLDVGVFQSAGGSTTSEHAYTFIA